MAMEKPQRKALTGADLAALAEEETVILWISETTHVLK
jgi:hypothetical protein